jgi:predicted esterase
MNRVLFTLRIGVIFAAAFFVVSIQATDAFARGKRPKVLKVPDVVEEKAKGFWKIWVKDDPAAEAHLLKVAKPEKGRKYDLVVSLHGHGGTPILLQQIARWRNCYVLAVHGRTSMGNGYAWNTADTKTIAGLTKYMIEKYPINPKTVLMTGHSAGGTMTLKTYTFAPQLWAGIITTAAPATPTSAHYNVRTVVFMGDQDPNYAGVSTVRSNFSHKKRRMSASLRIVKGLGHNMPAIFYLNQAMDWLLDSKTRGWEVELPKAPPVQDSKPYCHILIRYRGSEGADDRAARTSKKRAKGELKMIKKYVDRKLGHFVMEAARYSHDDGTAASGGLINEEGLAAFSAELKEAATKLKPEGCSEVLESTQGFHLIYRCKGKEDKENSK